MAALAEELSDAYSRLFDEMVRYVRRRIPEPSEAEDIVNECFLKIWQGNRDIWHFPAYLHTAVRREIAGRLRARREPTVPLDSIVSDAGDTDVERAVVERERGRELRNALASLPKRQAAVLSLWGEGMAPAEIARELSSGETRWSSNQVSCLLNRAKRSVRRQLAERGVASVLVPVWWRFKLWVTSGSEKVHLLLDPALLVPPILALMVVLGGLSSSPRGNQALPAGPTRMTIREPAVPDLSARLPSWPHDSSGTPGTTDGATGEPSRAARVEVGPKRDGRHPGLLEQALGVVEDPSKAIPGLGCWGLEPICSGHPPEQQ